MTIDLTVVSDESESDKESDDGTISTIFDGVSDNDDFACGKAGDNMVDDGEDSWCYEDDTEWESGMSDDEDFVPTSDADWEDDEIRFVQQLCRYEFYRCLKAVMREHNMG